MYKVLKFNKISSANKKATKMKTMFGYKPTVFKVRKPGQKGHYAIVKPSGLKRI